MNRGPRHRLFQSFHWLEENFQLQSKHGSCHQLYQSFYWLERTVHMRAQSHARNRAFRYMKEDGEKEGVGLSLP